MVFRVIKIAVTCAARIPPDQFGGAEKTVGYRAYELDKMGYDVTLFSCGPYKPEHGKLVHWNGDAKDVPVDEFDVIDNNGPTEFGCKHVMTTINGPFYPKRNVVCISESQARGMGFWPACKVVHYGTDVDYWAFHEPKEDWFLYYSRVAHGKGCHIAIDLAKREGFPLKIVGEDKAYVEPVYVAQMRDMCRDIPNIEWVGPRYDNSTPFNNLWYVQRAKALLFFQNWGEAFGLVMIEALAAGTPVVAGGLNGAPPEVIVPGRTGYLCQDFNPPYNDFAEAVKNIWKIDPKICRSEAVTRWSARRMAEDYVKLYEDVIAGRYW